MDSGIDNGEAGQEIPELSRDKHIDSQIAEEDLASSVLNPDAAQASEIQPEADLASSAVNSAASQSSEVQREADLASSVTNPITAQTSEIQPEADLRDSTEPSGVTENLVPVQAEPAEKYANVAERESNIASEGADEDTGVMPEMHSAPEVPASNDVSIDPPSSSLAENSKSNNVAPDPLSKDIVEDLGLSDVAEHHGLSDVTVHPASLNEAEEPAFVAKLENASDENAILDVKPVMKNELAHVKVENGQELEDADAKAVDSEDTCYMETAMEAEKDGDYHSHEDGPNQSFIFDYTEGEESGTEEEQAAFMKELETFHKENNLEFKPPKFYGEGLNCLKLWRAVTRMGGYDQVTSCKLWRQVGESFRPPKTCTTVSWSFRIFYEKALLEYEKHKIRSGELQVSIASLPAPMALDHQVGGNQSSGSGRARRDAAARAMQGWHSQRLLGNGEVGDPIIKDKTSVSLLKRDKHLKSIGSFKRKKPSSMERSAVKVARLKISKPQMDTMVVDVGPPADWVKINVRKTRDCFEIYALVPGLLREEVHVQSDPAGRLVISGEPEQLDNPWGVTPFKKVITLPSRIDPHQTSAVVTLHGQLFVRAPFEQLEL